MVMRFSIVFLLVFILSCSEDSLIITDQVSDSGNDKFVIELSNGSEVTIAGKNIPVSYLEQLKFKLESRIHQKMLQKSFAKKDQIKRAWQDADFLPIDGLPGSYEWRNVDVNKVTEQSYYIHHGPYGDDIVIWSIDSIHIRLDKKQTLVDFIKSDFVPDDSNLCSVTARLYGAKTDIYIQEELLQSETRYFRKGDTCLDTHIYKSKM